MRNRARHGLAASGLALLLWSPAAGQTPTLSLTEALDLARGNNPTFLSARNDEGPAAWAVREAYGGFLPDADVNGSVRYEAGGSALFGSFTAADIGISSTPAYYFSSYGATATLTLSPRTWYNLSEQKANQRAIVANVSAAELRLENAVTRAYLSVLRERDDVALRSRRLERAEENLTLAETRAEAGVATRLDAKQAQVERGRAQVEVLTARARYQTRKLRLLQQIGVDIDADVELTTEFTVFEPVWTRSTLLEMAMAGHPELRSLEARERAQDAAARTAWSSYLPSLTARASTAGYTRQVGEDEFLVAQGAETLAQRRQSCLATNELYARLADPLPLQDCDRFELTPEREDSLQTAVVAANRAFPFDFDQQPLELQLAVRLPVFTGFQRQRQVAEAEAAAEDTRLQLEAERLRLRSDVAAALLALETAHEAVQIEESNRSLAIEQLEQARERYRVGVDSFLGLTEAETLRTQAAQAYLAAVYTFPEALADLNAAVGQPLRPQDR
ncbi:MAG: TolC family protein [Gemmatimonadota bacterium]